MGVNNVIKYYSVYTLYLKIEGNRPWWIVSLNFVSQILGSITCHQWWQVLLLVCNESIITLGNNSVFIIHTFLAKRFNHLLHGIYRRVVGRYSYDGIWKVIEIRNRFITMFLNPWFHFFCSLELRNVHRPLWKWTSSSWCTSCFGGSLAATCSLLVLSTTVS